MEDSQFQGTEGTHFSTSGIVALGASNGVAVVNDIQLTNVTGGVALELFCGETANVSVSDVKVQNERYGITSAISHTMTVCDNELINCAHSSIVLNTYSYQYDLPTGSSIIKDNYIIMDDSRFGINGLRLINVLVKDNTIIGNGSITNTAIRAVLGENWEILENDLCDLTPNNPVGATIAFFGTLNSFVIDNANQVVGGTTGSHPSNYIGEAKECEIDLDPEFIFWPRCSAGGFYFCDPGSITCLCYIRF